MCPALVLILPPLALRSWQVRHACVSRVPPSRTPSELILRPCASSSHADVLTPPSSPPAVQLSSAPSLYPSWAPYQPTPTLSTPPTPTPRGPNFSPPSSAHGHSAESAGSGADARLLSASVHDGLDPTWARAAVLEEEDGSGALEEGDRGFAEPVKRGKGGTDGRQGSRALPEIWTHAAKVRPGPFHPPSALLTSAGAYSRLTVAPQVYLASTACFAGFTLALVVALEVAQAASNQAVIARFNLYLQIPVILCQLFLLCSAWVAVQSQNMVLVFFVTAFNVYLVRALRTRPLPFRRR